jgi:hypothetical protein
MTDPIDKAVEELVKQLPIRQIYEDGASAATREAGQLLADLIKTVRLALFPLQVAARLSARAVPVAARSPSASRRLKMAVMFPPERVSDIF